MATSIACPMPTAPTRLWLLVGLTNVPPGGRWTFPSGSMNWGLVLPDPSREGRPAPRWRCPRVYTPDYPMIVGPWIALSRSPPSLASNQRLVKGEMSGSSPNVQGATPPLLPLTRISSGGLHSEPLYQKARRPDNWCQLVDILRMSISTPRAMQVALSQEPATLCSTVTSPQQLDQGPIIRKLSRDGNQEQILHLILEQILFIYI